MISTTGRSAKRQSPAGFTLLELIAVLVLISTILAIAAPSLRGFVHGRQTTDVAVHLLALTHLARSQAAIEGCVHRLNVDDDEGSYWLTIEEGGAFVEVRSDNGREYVLPRGVTIELDTPDMPIEIAESLTEALYIQFYPDGRCDRATIELSDGSEDPLQVTCESPLERFRIITPSEDERL